MRVRAKVTIVLALLFVALIAAQWAVEQRLMLPKFVELERASAHTDAMLHIGTTMPITMPNAAMPVSPCRRPAMARPI